MDDRAVDARRIGQNVRNARLAADKSLETVAGLAGRSKAWLSNVERGRTRLERRSDIAALAEALEVSADYLLGEPAPEIRPRQRALNLAALQKVLLDGSPIDPLDIPARPIDALAAEVGNADAALRNADPASTIRLLTGAIGELCVHAATGAENSNHEELLATAAELQAMADLIEKYPAEAQLIMAAFEDGLTLGPMRVSSLNRAV